MFVLKWINLSNYTYWVSRLRVSPKYNWQLFVVFVFFVWRWYPFPNGALVDQLTFTPKKFMSQSFLSHFHFGSFRGGSKHKLCWLFFSWKWVGFVHLRILTPSRLSVTPKYFISFYIFGKVCAMYSLSKISVMNNTGLKYVPDCRHFQSSWLIFTLIKISQLLYFMCQFLLWSIPMFGVLAVCFNFSLPNLSICPSIQIKSAD